jgi:hypothetical protein
VNSERTECGWSGTLAVPIFKGRKEFAFKRKVEVGDALGYKNNDFQMQTYIERNSMEVLWDCKKHARHSAV